MTKFLFESFLRKICSVIVLAYCRNVSSVIVKEQWFALYWFKIDILDLEENSLMFSLTPDDQWVLWEYILFDLIP